MLKVEDALELVMSKAKKLEPITIETRVALGRTLAEDITSDIESPPHDKSVVDGFAVIAEDVSERGKALNILEEVTAGEVPRKNVVAGTATRIMTGAPIPSGANAVVMVEKTELFDSNTVRILE